MSKEAMDQYVEMTKKILSEPDEWQDTDEGEEHLNEMDDVWYRMTEAETQLAQIEIGKI